MFERTLIITPHFDDETIGCGGLMSELAAQGKEIRIVVVATSNTHNYSAGRVVDNDERLHECIHAMYELGVPYASIFQLDGFEDGKLDQVDKKELVTALDKQIREFKPTAVLFPYSSHHQDHQALFHASVAALRPTIDTNFIKLKAMYEYPYINSWSSNVNPNSKLYYPLTADTITKKAIALRAYKTQLLRDHRDILSIESIMTLAKVRGTEIGHEYAEAFYPMTIVVGGDNNDN